MGQAPPPEQDRARQVVRLLGGARRQRRVAPDADADFAERRLGGYDVGLLDGDSVREVPRLVRISTEPARPTAILLDGQEGARTGLLARRASAAPGVRPVLFHDAAALSWQVEAVPSRSRPAPARRRHARRARPPPGRRRGGGDRGGDPPAGRAGDARAYARAW